MQSSAAVAGTSSVNGSTYHASLATESSSIGEHDSGQEMRNSTELRLSRELPRSLPTTFRISNLRTWTGRVIEADDELFSVILTPDSGTPGDVVIADFDRSLVVDETETLGVGDVVYVTTRMIRGAHGGRSETSSVRLRRPGNWTQEDVDRIRARANSLSDEMSDLID